MKPFNLEEAKAGKPIEFRKGTPARFIAYIPEADEDLRVVIFVPDLGHCLSYNKDGLIRPTNNGFQEYDLFMFSDRKKGWLNLYVDPYARAVCHAEYYVWPNRKDADIAARHATTVRIACIEVTYEEGEGLS